MAQGKPWLTRLGERLEQAGQPSAELVTTWLAFLRGLNEVWKAANPEQVMDAEALIALAHAEAAKGWTPSAAWTHALMEVWAELHGQVSRELS
jgi:hypothetical protein